MSREDPQLRIRLPTDLKEKIDETSKKNGRSMNAEIVHRLEQSFPRALGTDELIPAKDALVIIEKAKHELSKIILLRTISSIKNKIRIGHATFYVDLSDLDLEGLEDDDFVSVFQPTFERLKSQGYAFSEQSWDVDGFMIEIPVSLNKNNKKPSE